MRKFWLATALVFAVGGVLGTGTANAATPTTDPGGSTTVVPVFVVGGTSTTPAPTSTSTDTTSDKDAAKQAKQDAKDAKDAAKQDAKDAKDAAKQDAKDAKDAAKAAAPAPPAPAAPAAPPAKGPKADGKHQGAPVPTKTPAKSKAPWIFDTSLFGGGGRAWG